MTHHRWNSTDLHEQTYQMEAVGAAAALRGLGWTYHQQ
jgi:hypothetical protein